MNKSELKRSIKNNVKLYMIRSCKDVLVGSLGDMRFKYWSKEHGWVIMRFADLYTLSEIASMEIPTNGKVVDWIDESKIMY